MREHRTVINGGGKIPKRVRIGIESREAFVVEKGKIVRKRLLGKRHRGMKSTDKKGGMNAQCKGKIELKDITSIEARS